MGLAIAGIAAGVLGAGATAYSASQSGKSSGLDPAPAARSTIAGYQQAMPGSLALNQYYQPQFLGLGGQNLQQILFGRPAGTQTRPKWDIHGRIIGYEETPTQADPGLLSTVGQAAPVIQGLADQSANAGRQSDIDALLKYLPQARQAYEQATPELAQLRTSLAYRAQQGLSAGGALLPEDYARITRDVRTNYAGRGLAGTDPEALARAVQLYTGGEQARGRREQFGLNTADILGRTQPDYASFILGQRGTFPQALGLATGQQPLAYQRWFDPYNPTAGSIAQTGTSLDAQARANQAQLYEGAGAGLLRSGSSLLAASRNPPGYDPNYGRDFSNIVDYP